VNTIAVIGAGTMGHGIAQVAALAGYKTVLTDADDRAIGTGLERIQTNLEGGVARGKVTKDQMDGAVGRIRSASIDEAIVASDLIIEAIVEDLTVKQALFSHLAARTKPNAILATNTSSLSVSEIARATDRPHAVIGMHFFNPVHIMKLVEIVRHTGCADATVEEVRAVALRMGKEPIVVADTPGFASSRLGVVLGLEAMRMVEQGVASAQDIDKALELGYGHPMGPLKVTDLVGLDVRLAISEYLHATLQDSQYAPPNILKDMVAAGHLGKKSGKGFYEWPKPTS